MEKVREEFVSLFKTHIKREGSKELMAYLEKSDFFVSPASTRYHGAEKGGLVSHSVDAFHRFVKQLELEYGKEWEKKISYESVAIIALLHDVCKIDTYKEDFKNVKDDNGVWQKVPVYVYDEKLPYGHGEKSVYIVSGFMKLTREEAMAINWHMGGFDPRAQAFGGTSLRAAYEQFPIALIFHIADNLAAYFD